METVIAIGAIVTAGATVALAIITGKLARFAKDQISSAREEARISRTLTACDRYDADPLLDQCLRKLRTAIEDGSFRHNPTPYKAEFSTVLNYFESLAIGVERDLYDEDVVKEHFAHIFQNHFNEYFGDEAPKITWLADDDFESFKGVCLIWSKGGRACKKKRN